MDPAVLPMTLELDLGPKQREARLYADCNPQATLRQFLAVYPARAAAPLPADAYDRPLAAFLLSPIVLGAGQGVALAPAADGEPSCKIDLEGLYAADVAQADGAAEFPERLSDNEAVQRAYRHEFRAIATFLQHDLSVLITCDKILTEHTYEFVCQRAGKRPVLDDATPEGAGDAPGGELDRALQGGGGGSLEARLPVLLRSLKPDEVLVLRSLDVLNTPPLIEMLYQGAQGDKRPQLLGFLDPSLEAKKVLTDRFAVHYPIMGLSRFVQPDPDRPPVHTVAQLLTARERRCFKTFDAEGLYKNVSGLNAIQFRNAMRYVGATVAADTDPRDIYDVIRQFKRSSSNEIEIPNTSFQEIGGYDRVKQELQRIIALVTGRVAGIDDRQREKLVPRGFLFHGPPGTGKTLFAKAIANEMNATIQMVSGPEIMDKYVGQSESNLRHIFATARRNAPSVIFFDEFDSIASQRSTQADGGARANNAVVAQLLTELDGFREEQAVLVIGTSNRLDIIDEALLRPSRLRPIEIGLPDYAARRSVAAIHARNFGVDTLLAGLCRLVLEALPAWPADGTIPLSFLEALFREQPPLRLRWEMESRRDGFARELHGVYQLVREAQAVRSTAAGPEEPFLQRLEDRLLQLARGYGLDLTRPAESAADAAPSMQKDVLDLLSLVREERSHQGDFSPEVFLNGVLDLVAEYTQGFNNDEIRAIFQEVSLEHHMEGQLVTPRYVGMKIGLLKKRRDERAVVHLSTERGRR